MVEALYPRFIAGTHRLVSPERTMRRITPMLECCGITRIAEITRLDEDFGVPTYTAIRPEGLVLQAGNGKGLTPAAARVSAAMEAIELHHAEHPDPSRLVSASMRQMNRRGLDVRVPLRDEADRRVHYSADRVIDWVRARELLSGAKPWIPASAAFFVEPTIYRTSTNGLASGNHVVEATLHGLYELLERDAISRVLVGTVLDIQGTCRVIDPLSLDDDRLRSIVDKILAAQGQLVLLWVPSAAPVHVFWAIMLDHQPLRRTTALVTGAGAHIDPGVAAARAITEAVQSRLTIVQSSREDVVERPSFISQSAVPGPAFRFFAGLGADTRWADVADLHPQLPSTATDLREQLAGLLQSLEACGHPTVLRVDLRRPEFDLPVVKLIVPSLRFRRELF